MIVTAQRQQWLLCLGLSLLYVGVSFGESSREGVVALAVIGFFAIVVVFLNVLDTHRKLRGRL
jgi:hypothetical protein